MVFWPKKKQVNPEVKIPENEETDVKTDAAGIEMLEYNKRWRLYRLRLTKDDLRKTLETPSELINGVYEWRTG